jgi:hypothetical protein
MSQQEIEETINELWDLYDDAEKSGNKDLAADFASRAFALVGKLPENCAFLTKH